MRVFLAGATGVIGRRLTPMLLDAGHHVSAMTRTPEKLDALRAGGAEAVLADALDADSVRAAVSAARPDAVIHQLTAIPARIDPRRIERDFELNDRLRSEGTAILVAAAREAGATRILAQSIAFAYAPGPAGTIHGEQDPLISDGQAPRSFRRSAGALRELERTVAEAGGMVLRYGYLYGRASAISSSGSMARDIRRGRMPIVGSGSGVWSFIHVDDAAGGTLAALKGATGAAAYNVVDDDPAPVSQWLPALAAALGASPPRRVPVLLARVVAGAYGVASMTTAQGASNALIKRDLDWTPAHPSWRSGFRTALGGS